MRLIRQWPPQNRYTRGRPHLPVRARLDDMDLSLEQAAADARFPREERHAAAGRIAQHYAGQGPEVRR